MSTSTGSGSTPPADPQETPDQLRRQELAQFLKSKRHALRPEHVGLRIVAKRRSPGLSREEVAVRAGMSVTWYTWLEQSRSISPSRDALDDLAWALCLSRVEREYLFRLGLPSDHLSAPDVDTTREADHLKQFLDALHPNPAYAMSRCWDVIMYNSMANAMFGAFEPRHGLRVNILHRLFMHKPWRELFDSWPTVASTAVAQFRVATASFFFEEDVTSLIRTLGHESPEFAELWKKHAVTDTPERRKTIHHPVVGKVTLNYTDLHPQGLPIVESVIVYSPLSQRDQDLLYRLSRHISESL